MSLPVPDRDTAVREMRDSAARWADLLRGVSEPERNAIGHWSIGEVAAHTTHILRIFAEMLDGASSPVVDHLRMAEHWEQELAADGEREPKVLADRIGGYMASIADATTEDRWRDELTWHGGIPVPVYSLPCIVVNEAEVHGLDVASAESTPWAISRTKALLAINGLFPVLHRFVRPDVAEGMNANFALRLKGEDPVYLSVLDGELRVAGEPPARIDCRVSADPVEYLLVGYGRKSKWGPIATGKIVAYGRKPWLSLKLANLFYSP